MSRTVLGFLVSLLLVALAVAPAAAQGEKPLFKVGLMPPSTKPANPKAAAARTESLNEATEAFATSRRFTVIERQELATIFKEKDLKNFLGKGDNRLADLHGLDFLGIVEPSVITKKMPQRLAGKLWDKVDPKGNRNEEVQVTNWTLEVRLLDVRTGQVTKIVTSETSSGLMPVPSVRAAGKHLHDAIREAYPPFGEIVRIEGKDVTIDLGESAGLQKKDVFEIVEEGEQLFHPSTGKPMESYLVVIGELKVTELWPNMANGKITSSKEGKAIKPGCYVRFKGGGSFWKRTLDRMTR